MNRNDAQEAKAPRADFPAYCQGGLIFVAGQRLASVRDGELRRTFDSRRELLNGALLFRRDVLDVATESGARVIVARDRASGKRWRVGLDAFKARGWSYSHPLYGDQIGLGLSEWELIGPEMDTPETVQLSLFGEMVR